MGFQQGTFLSDNSAFQKANISWEQNTNLAKFPIGCHVLLLFSFFAPLISKIIKKVIKPS